MKIELTIGDKRYVALEEDEYRRLKALSPAMEDLELPPLPDADAKGNRPAVAFARASIARKVIAGRKRLGLSQTELAKRAGVRLETINRLEKGHHTPSLATLGKIARVLGEFNEAPSTANSARRPALPLRNRS